MKTFSAKAEVKFQCGVVLVTFGGEIHCVEEQSAQCVIMILPGESFKCGHCHYLL